MIDKLVWFAIVGMSVILFMLITRYIYRETTEFSPMSEQIEKETGCKYLGHPYHQMTLGYFDCGTEIVIKRVSK